MAKGNEGAEPFICRPFNNSINTHHTIRDRGNRLILGVKDDVRITADHLPSPTPHISEDLGTDPTERPFYKGFVFLAVRHALRRAFF